MALDATTKVAGLRGFAAAAGPILDRLADAGELLTAHADAPAGMAARARHRMAASRFPGSAAWPAMTAEDRDGWWATRIWVVLGSGAIAPELLGPAADRLLIGPAVEAAARGLVVCATAREHGVTTPIEHARLVSRVLLGREIPEPGADTVGWTQPQCPQTIVDAVAVSVRIGRTLSTLAADVAAEIDELVPKRRKKGWGRLPGVAAVRAVTDLRSTLRDDARATAALLDVAASRAAGPRDHGGAPDRRERDQIAEGIGGPRR